MGCVVRRSLRILCVDHDDDNRLIIKLAFQLDPDIFIATARSADEALKECGTGQDFDLAVIDGDGITTEANVVVDWLIRQGKSGPLPFVLLTADPRLFDQHIVIGAVGAILKPFDPLQLASDVRKMMETLTLDRT